MEYRIIYATLIVNSIGSAAQNLSADVNAAIADGWIPQGGICYDTKGMLLQAIVRESSFARKKCPSCAEMIKLEALKCRCCGHDFDPSEVTRQVEDDQKERGGLQCPQCKKPDVRRGAYIEDGSVGDWCPNCKMSLQKMRGKI